MARRKRNAETKERDSRMKTYFKDAHGRISDETVKRVEKIRLKGVKTRKATA